MNRTTALLTGAGAAISARVLLARALRAKFRGDVARLNAGDYAPLLDAYADDAVLAFNDGDHRWAGEHRGRAAIERFLQDFTSAGLQGELREVFMAGPPWRMTLLARFDDRAEGPGGEELYANRTVLLLRTRWGKVVRQEDYYEDTARMAAFDRRLRALGVLPVGEKPPAARRSPASAA